MQRTSGFTLVEVSVVVAVTSLVLLAVGPSLLSSQDAMNEYTVIAVADDRARRVVDRIGEELRFADSTTFSPSSPVAESALEFQPVQGWDDNGAILGAARKLALSSGEVQIDGQTIATDVKSLSFTLDGNALRLEVVITATVSSGGSTRTIDRTIESVVELLN